MAKLNFIGDIWISYNLLRCSNRCWSCCRHCNRSNSCSFGYFILAEEKGGRSSSKSISCNLEIQYCN